MAISLKQTFFELIFLNFDPVLRIFFTNTKFFKYLEVEVLLNIWLLEPINISFLPNFVLNKAMHKETDFNTIGHTLKVLFWGGRLCMSSPKIEIFPLFFYFIKSSVLSCSAFYEAVLIQSF